MKLEEIVTCIEYSAELKTLGVTQKSIFYWLKLIGTKRWSIVNEEEVDEAAIVDDIAISTYTASEHLAAMPAALEQEDKNYDLMIDKIKFQGPEDIYTVSYSDINYELENIEHLIQFSDYKLADALAKMRVYLIRNKLVK